VASGFKIASAYVSVTLDRDQLRSDIAGLPAQLNSDVDRAGKDVGKRLGKGIGDGADGAGVGSRIGNDVDRTLQPRAQRSGGDAGDKLAKGMAQGVQRSSPLIVAAITGGLALGAPALLGTAGSLFIAIAALAVHSNQTMQDAFSQTKDAIASTFTDAAQVTVPFFVRSMQRIGDEANRLGPQLRAAFSSLGGPIDSLTTGIIQLERNAMPGLVTAVKSVGPVFDGLKTLLADIGTGVSQMFSILSEHTGAAGTVLSNLGRALEALLPALAQILGAGVELASKVLPPVATALQGVGAALNFLAPVLPAVLAGFLGFKAISMLPALLGRFGAAGAAAGTRLSALGGGLTGIGVVAGVVTAAFMVQSAQIDKWAHALLDGGAAAEQARAEMSKWKQVTDTLDTGVNGFIGHLTGYGTALDVTSQNQSKAAQTAKQLYAAMSPLERAQQDATKAQNDYLEAVKKYGPASGQAAGAAVTYRDAMQHQKDIEDQLSQAIHGVTQAMIDQANEALAALDSGLAYRQAQAQAATAAADFNKALSEGKAHLNDNSAASLTYETALASQAEAAGKAAADQSGLTDQTELTKVSQQATLAELLKLKAQYGSEFPASLQQTIDRLQAAGVKLDDVGAKKPTPTVNLNAGPFNSILGYVTGAINTLHGKKPTPTAFMNTQPFGGAAASMNAMLAYLASRHITPSASLIAYTLAAEQALNNAARNRTSYVTQYYVTGGIGSRAAAATGGRVGDVVALAGRRFDAGGKLSGPGGPTDDLIQAVTGRGAPLRVSDDEWVIKGSSSAKYGDYKMAAVNDGRAFITVPGPRPAARFAGGDGLSQRSTDGEGVSIGQLHVHVAGIVDFTQPGAADRVAKPIQQAILKLERSRR
jgi:hypothetical protein